MTTPTPVLRIVANPATVDIEVEAGYPSISFGVTFNDPQGQPIDITGFAFEWSVFRGTEVLFSKSTEDGGLTIPDGTNGRVEFSAISADDTLKLLTQQATHGLTKTSADIPEPWLRGVVSSSDVKPPETV